MDMKQAKIGRPRKSLDGEVRNEIVKFLLTSDEKETLNEAAAIYGLSLSEYVRDWLLAESSILLDYGKAPAVSAICASAEDKARALGADVEITPVFKTYKAVDEVANVEG